MLALIETVRSLLSFYPRSLRAEVEAAMPVLSLHAQRLAMEVASAELEGIPFAEAIDRPDYPLMGRMHYGLRDLLQWRVPRAIRKVFETIGQLAAEGDFDSLRGSLFAVARRRDDNEGAVMRFVFYEMIGLNLLLATWDEPSVEASGALDRAQASVQQQLEELLLVPEMYEADVRPLHVLVAEAMLRLGKDAEDIMRHQFEDTIDDIVEITALTQISRSLEAPNAAALRVGRGEEELGSQQIADRYPWHFPSSNSVEQRRSRMGKRSRKEGILALSVRGEMFVDIMRATSRKEGAR